MPAITMASASNPGYRPWPDRITDLSTASKRTRAISSARSCDWLRRGRQEPAGWPGSTTATSTRCGPSTGRRPTTPRTWISARSRRQPRPTGSQPTVRPPRSSSMRGSLTLTYALTDALKVDVGARVNHYDYRFSSCLSGWGSAHGAAIPSCSGLIALSSTSFNPKFNLVCTRSARI